MVCYRLVHTSACCVISVLEPAFFPQELHLFEHILYHDYASLLLTQQSLLYTSAEVPEPSGFPFHSGAPVFQWSGEA